MGNNKLSIILLGIIACLLAFIGYNSIIKNDKIAYIDSSKLIEKSKSIQLIQQEVKLEEEKAKSNLDTLMQEFDRSMKGYEKNIASMSVKEKAMGNELLKNKQAQLMQYQQAVKQKVNNAQQEKMQNALKNINMFISDYGKKNGYTVILATSNGSIAYGDESVDITEEIIEGINK